MFTDAGSGAFEDALPLTIFANFFINSEERLLRLKDSFFSFEKMNPERWVVNIRGDFRSEAEAFLREQLGGDKLKVFRLDSRWGWFHDTRKMLESIRTEFVLFWVEDHINIAPVSVYRGILQEMKANDTDLLRYTWWCLGQMPRRYNGISKSIGKYIQAFEVNRVTHRIVQKNSPGSYIIDIPCIFKVALFKAVVTKRFDPILPRFSIRTPFDFEKCARDIHWLPLKKAIPNFELFASIDDDLGVEGYCLQSRGLYPIREVRRLPVVSRWQWLKDLLPRRIIPFLYLFKRVSYFF